MNSFTSPLLAFYRANKKTKEGLLLDPPTFFKYRGRHLQFQKFWASRKNGRRTVIKGQLRRFIDGLKEVDVRNA